MKRIHWALRGAVACAALGLGGCAIVTSQPGGHGAQGMAYMLPRALLPVELSFDGVGFDLKVKEPVTTGDPNQLYALQRTGNIFTSDTVTLSVDPATGLLTGVDVKSDDKSAEALTQLITGVRAKKAESASGAGAERVVFSEPFDPGWSADAVAAYNRRLQEAALVALDDGMSASGCPGNASDACKALQQLRQALIARPLGLSVDGPAPSNTERADCSAGFCYRVNLPHLVRIAGTGASRSQHFALPNRSPTFVMALERWAFVRTTHDVKLQAGMVSSVTTDRPSSAAAVAGVPFAIAKGAVSSASELIQLKVDLSGKEKALSDAKVKEIEAKTKEKEAEAAAMKPLADAAVNQKVQELGTTPPAAAALTLRIGPPAKHDATANLQGPKVNPVPQAQDAASSPGAGSTGSLGGGGAKP